MSIDSAQYLSSTSTLEEGFLIDVIVNGGGESVSGVFTPEDIERFGIDKVPKAFTVDFELVDMSCRYKIEDTKKNLFKIYQSTAEQRDLRQNPPYGQVSLDTTKNWCINGRSSNIYPKEVPGIAPEGGNCENMQEIGEWGYWSPDRTNIVIDDETDFDTINSAGDWRATHVGGIPFYSYERIGTRAFLDYEIKVKVINSEGEIKETILTSEQKNALLGGIGQVRVVGNLLADEFCEIPGINYAIIERDGKRKIVEKSLVETYLFNYRNLVNFDNDYFEYQWRNIRIDPGVGADWIFGTTSGMNNALRQLESQNFTNVGCEIVNDNSVVCKSETQIAYPELQLILASNYLGISKDKRAELENRLDNLGNGIEELDLALEEQEQLLQNQLSEQEQLLREQIQSKYVELNTQIQSTSVASSSERAKIEQNINDLNNLLLQLEAETSDKDEQTKQVLTSQTEALKNELLSLQTELDNFENIAVTPIINKPKYGIPKIKDVSFSDVYANQIGDVMVQVDNIGNQTDSFDLDIKCTPTDLTFGAKRVSINPNSGTTETLKYNGEAGNYSCTVTATAINNPANKDSFGLKVEIKDKPIPTEPEEVEKEVEEIKKEIVEENPENPLLYLGIGVVGTLVLGLIIYNITRRKRK